MSKLNDIKARAEKRREERANRGTQSSFGGRQPAPYLTLEPVEQPAEEAPRAVPPMTAPQMPKRVTRAMRLAAKGLPPVRLAAAMARIMQTPLEDPNNPSLTECARGVRLGTAMFEDIKGLTSERGVPQWIRAAIEFVSEQGVSPEWVRAEAHNVAALRRGDLGKNVMVSLGRTLLDAVQEMGRRSRLTDKQVIEGCIGAFYRAHVEALGEGEEAGVAE